MPNISFASGGDSDKLDFVAYVAKDRQNVRSCYVLECAGGLSQDVITTIGQAFELRSVAATLQAALQLKPPLHKKMLIFVFYSIFKLKFCQKNIVFTLKSAACIGTSTVNL